MSSGPNLNPNQDPGLVFPLRKYFLFRADFEDAALQAAAPELKPRWMYPQGVPDQPVALSDYTDYDNPRSINYWRNRLPFDSTWAENYKTTFMQFAATVFQQLNSGNIGLKALEITRYVRNIGQYSVKVSDLSNILNLTFGLEDNQGPPAPGFTHDRLQLGNITANLSQYLPRKDDIVMVRVLYPGGVWEDEFTGYVIDNSYGSTDGSVDAYTVSVAGRSKMLFTSDIIKQRSVADAQFLPTIELNQYTEVSVFQDNFNSLSILNIFENILKQAFSYTAAPLNNSPTGYTQSFVMGSSAFAAQVTGTAPTQTVEMVGGGFQFNFFALLTIFLMTITETSDATVFPQRNWGTQQSLFYYRELATATDGVFAGPADHSNTYLSPLNTAVLQHGEEQVFNTMVSRGLELFFSQMAKPAEVLAAIRTNDFYDVFESRQGTITCQPGRYNKIERQVASTSTLSNTPTVVINADTTADGTPGPPSLDSIENIFKQVGSCWEFNPGADFYIAAEDILDFPSVAFDDSILESHIDVKMSFTLYGDTPINAAGYTDPDVLFSSGLRSGGPVSNVNALNADAPKIFAPLALAMANAGSRPLNLVVKDDRQYQVGKLYYLQAMDCVAYLSDDNIMPNYGDVGGRSLAFTMVRKCVRRPLAEIALIDKNAMYWEAVNLALCYTTDPPDSNIMSVAYAASVYGVTSVPQRMMTVPAATMLDVVLGKGLNLVQAMQANFNPGNSAASLGPATNWGASGPQVIMFKYIPSILDIALEVEAEPRLASTEANPQGGNAALATKIESANRAIAPILGNNLGMTYGFQQPLNRQFYEPLLPAIIKASGSVNENQGIPPSGFQQIMTPGLVNYAVNPALTGQTPYVEQGGVISNTDAANLVNAVAPGTYVPTQVSNPIFETQTPFLASAFNAIPNLAKISQLLVNKLASVDLALKFLNPDLQVNPAAIPQYYTYQNGRFYLFSGSTQTATTQNGRFYLFSGSTQTATTYFQNFSVANGGGLKPVQIAAFLSAPCVLQMPLLTNQAFQTLSNSCYAISSIGSGIFNLPYGHFVIADGNQLAFIEIRSLVGTVGVTGGQFEIGTGGIPGTVVIAAVNPSQCVLVADKDYQGLEANPYSVSVPGGVLYFMTPYAEPTVERLLDVALPVKWGGQLTQAQLNAEKNTAVSEIGSLTLTSNNLRVSGDAVNLSIDYLAVSSGSDLIPQPERPLQKSSEIGKITGDSIYKRFETAFFAAPAKISGFQVPNQSAVAFSNALAAEVIYPNGTSGGTRNCIVYSLQIAGPSNATTGMQAEDSTYAGALVAAPASTAIQPKVPGAATASSNTTAQT